MENFEVVRPLVHSGQSYGPGETVTMSKREAVFLLAGGQIKRRCPEAKTEKPPPKKARRKKKKAPTRASSKKQPAPEVAAEAADKTLEEVTDG